MDSSSGGRSRSSSRAAEISSSRRSSTVRRRLPVRPPDGRRPGVPGVARPVEAVAFALTLPGTELGSSYGKPAVKVAANGHAFLFPSHEAETSFGVAMDLRSIEMLKETDPATFWQTPHYVGWEGVLIRYNSKDEERVRGVIERARDFVAAKPKAKPRKRN